MKLMPLNICYIYVFIKRSNQQQNLQNYNEKINYLPIIQGSDQL